MDENPFKVTQFNPRLVALLNETLEKYKWWKDNYLLDAKLLNLSSNELPKNIAGALGVYSMAHAYSSKFITTNPEKRIITLRWKTLKWTQDSAKALEHTVCFVVSRYILHSN